MPSQLLLISILLISTIVLLWAQIQSGLRSGWFYGALSFSLALNLGFNLFLLIPPTEQTPQHPPIIGVNAALQLGLSAQTQLPPPQPSRPAISWLTRTSSGRTVIKRPIVLFRSPAQAQFRAKGIQRYFASRHGWPDALNQPFEPRSIIVHSTEGEAEIHAFSIFDRNTEAQYLGGIWTHFSVGPAGQIYQYGPLNRISKGQAGLDDLAVGIEIVGTASLWNKDDPNKYHEQLHTGSIIQRWRQGNQAQLKAVADLIATLRAHYLIPASRVFSHEELGHIRDLKGNYPDYTWLRNNIRDRVYLGIEATLNKDFEPEEWYGFLEPYDRQDPGRDVMKVIRRGLMD